MLVVIAGVSLIVLTACIGGTGGEQQMQEKRSLPPVDLAVPQQFSTATFASG